MDKTIFYLKKKFSEYYKTSELELPDRFTRREWGFLFLGENYMQRHIAFRKSADVHRFLSGGSTSSLKSSKSFGNMNQVNIPAHSYYSTAYYQEPALQPMTAKVEGWLGADLIFDLDDDHVRNIEGLSSEERLKKVKDIVRYKLLDDFIFGDLGFDEKYIKIVFSGSRGYHIHIRDPRVFNMSSAERRDIVDYLLGTGLDLERIFPVQIFDTKEFAGKKYSKKPKINTPKLDSRGWSGRMARGIFELIKNISKLPDEDGLKELINICQGLRYKGKPIQTKDIEDIYYELFSRAKLKIDEKTFDQRNIVEIFSRDKLRDIFLQIVKEHQKIEMAGETDEPVTTDVKRLIRLPTSLHGKTGFRVVPLTIDALTGFEPFRDAIAFGNEPVMIDVLVKDRFEFRLGGERFSIDPGTKQLELPEAAAIYLICQRKAVIA